MRIMIRRCRSEISKTLRLRYGGRAAGMIELIEAEFESMRHDIEFIRHSRNPMDRRVAVAALLLALMKVLRNHNFGFDAIRDVSLEVANNLVTPKNRFHLFLKRMQTAAVVRPFVQRLLERKIRAARSFTEPRGFSVGYVPGNDSGLLFGIDIHQCGICILFAHHGCSDFSKILCEVDYITSAIAGLSLHRSSTIANGGSHCDFRFYRRTIPSRSKKAPFPG